MRIPAAHRLTMGYVRKFGLVTQPFIMARNNQFVLINNRRMTWSEFYENRVIPGFKLNDNERGKAPQNWRPGQRRMLEEVVPAVSHRGHATPIHATYLVGHPDKAKGKE